MDRKGKACDTVSEEMQFCTWVEKISNRQYRIFSIHKFRKRWQCGGLKGGCGRGGGPMPETRYEVAATIIP